MCKIYIKCINFKQTFQFLILKNTSKHMLILLENKDICTKLNLIQLLIWFILENQSLPPLQNRTNLPELLSILKVLLKNSLSDHPVLYLLTVVGQVE